MRTLFAILLVLVAAPGRAQQDTTVYLTLDQAPKSVFPDAQIERKDIPSNEEFREKLKSALGRVTPTVWEPKYVTFVAARLDVDQADFGVGSRRADAGFVGAAAGAGRVRDR